MKQLCCASDEEISNFGLDEGDDGRDVELLKLFWMRAMKSSAYPWDPRVWVETARSAWNNATGRHCKMSSTMHVSGVRADGP